MTTKPKNEAELILAARKKLTPMGTWKKHSRTGTSKTGTPQMCLIQAIESSDGHLVKPTVDKYVLPTIKKLYPGRGTSIPAFNDHTLTTKYDVLRVLDESHEKAASDLGIPVEV